MRRALTVAALLGTLPMPAFAEPPQRIRSVQIAAGERCPASTRDEIVVCAPADEPYRIPKRFRGQEPAAGNAAWGARAVALDEDGREAGGLPSSCSPIGAGGIGGCGSEAIRQWYAERAEAKRRRAGVP